LHIITEHQTNTLGIQDEPLLAKRVGSQKECTAGE